MKYMIYLKIIKINLIMFLKYGMLNLIGWNHGKQFIANFRSYYYKFIFCYFFSNF